jgi:hypothetical protein
VGSETSVIRRLRILGSISGVQGVFYVVYAILIVVGVARFGVSGPREVANASGVTLEVVIFLFFGLGMLLVAGGWFAAKRWARAPFLLAQLLALVVSIPMVGAADALQKWLAILVTLAAIVGIFLAFTPTVTRYLLRDEAGRESP